MTQTKKQQKAKIWFKDGAWHCIIPTGLEQIFCTNIAACFCLEQYFKRQNRLKKALALIFDMNEAMLSIEEAAVVSKIKKEQKCSKKQYGWLKGILERQQ